MFSNDVHFEGESKWLHRISDLHLFLLDMKRSYPLVYLQKLLAPRQMDWDITRGHDGVVVGKFGSHGPYKDSLGRFVTVLLPVRVNREHLVGVTTTRAKTFLSEFAPKGGQYLSNNFRIAG